MREMRLLLAAASQLYHARSSVTGRPLTLRAMAYQLWAADHLTSWSFGRRTPPPLAPPAELERERADAVRVVRATLLDRARRDGDAGEVARLRVAGDPLLTPLSRPRLDHAALAEQVARRYPRSGVDGTAARRAERHMERVLAEAQAWEYRHPGREGLTGRQPLP